MVISGPEGCLIPEAARGLHVLLVDRDPLIRMYMTSILEEQLYKVRTTGSASIALTMLQEGEEQFDLVMADSDMNEMDIFDFLDCVVHERDIPIIITSMGESMEMARRALCGGASLFLQKPIGKREIVNLWQHVFTKRTFHEKLAKQKAVDTNQEKIVKVVDPGLCRISTRNNNSNQLLQVEVVDVDGGMLLSMESQDIYKEQMIISEEKGKELEESKRNIQRIKTMLEEDCYGDIDNEIPPTNTTSHVRRSIEMEKQVKSSNIIANGKSTSKFGIDKKGSKSKNRLDTVGSTKGRSCMKWTPALQRKFIEAVNALGEKKVSAKAVLRKMNDYNLTVRQIASHLQKYREGINPVAAFSSVPVVQPAMTRTTDTIHGSGGSYPSVLPEQHNSVVLTQEGGGVNIIPNPESFQNVSLGSTGLASNVWTDMVDELFVDDGQ